MIIGRGLFRHIHSFEQLKSEQRTISKILPERLSQFESSFGGVKISEECKDLMSKLLVYKDDQRMSKEELFRHPFVKDAPISHEEVLRYQIYRDSLNGNVMDLEIKPIDMDLLEKAQ